jgi:hypothetical protein
MLVIGFVTCLQPGFLAASQAVDFSNSARPGGLTAQQSVAVNTLQPVLTWSPYPKALFYRVAIFSVADPQNAIYSTYPEPVRDVSFKVPGGVLKAGGKYFWNVVAVERTRPSEGGTGIANRYFHIEQTSLVAYYPFDGDTRDYSGNGNHATNNGATFVSGKSGQALHFDGKNTYVSAPVNINPDKMPQMTMTAWARCDRAPSSKETVISHDPGGYRRTLCIDDRGGGLGWSAFSGSGGVLGYTPVTVGEWVFLAAVYDQNAGKVWLYVNDKSYHEDGTLSAGWDYINIGRNPSFGDYFSGDIDEVRIYNHALSASEIATLYKGQTPIPSDLRITKACLVGQYVRWTDCDTGQWFESANLTPGVHRLVVSDGGKALEVALLGGGGDYIVEVLLSNGMKARVAMCGPDAQNIRLLDDGQRMGWRIEGKRLILP